MEKTEKCIICGRQGIVTRDENERDKLIYSLWKKDCAKSLCDVLFSNDKFVQYFQSADFCLSCRKTTRDINLLWKFIKSLKRDLKELCAIIRKRLHVNHMNLDSRAPQNVVDDMIETVLLKDNLQWEFSYDDAVQIFYKVAAGLATMPEGPIHNDELFPEEIKIKVEPMDCLTMKMEPIKVEIYEESLDELEADITDMEEDSQKSDTKLRRGKRKYFEEDDEEEEGSKRPASAKKKPKLNGRKKKKYNPGSRKEYYSKTKDTIRCEIESCEKKFRSKTEMESHVLHFHKGIAKPYSCLLCPKKYKWKRSVRDHMLMAHTEEKDRFQHFCKFCSKGYVNEEELQTHYDSSHQGPNPFCCAFCPKVCTNFVSLKKHVQQEHPDVEKPKCDVCGKAFKSEQTLKCHRLLHQDPETHFQCPHCPHRSATMNRYKLHVKIHDEVRPFICELCGKGFKSLHALKGHALMHTDQIVYHCKICNKGFRSGTAGKRHEEVVHLQVKNYVCQVCGRPFGNSNHLLHHERIHLRQAEAQAK